MPTIGDLVIKISTQLDALESGMNGAVRRVEQSANQMEDAVSRAGERIQGVFRAMTAPLLALGTFEGLKALGEHAQHLVHLGERWEVGPENLAKLELAAKRSGTSLEAATHGAEKLASVIDEVLQGKSEKAASALQRLGLSATELVGKSPMEAELAVLAAVGEKTGSVMEKIALMRDLLGKSGAELARIAEQLNRIKPGETPSANVLNAEARGSAALGKLGNRIATGWNVAVGAIAAGAVGGTEYHPETDVLQLTDPMDRASREANDRFMAQSQRLKEQRATAERLAEVQRQADEAAKQNYMTGIGRYQSQFEQLQFGAEVAQGGDRRRLELERFLKQLEGQIPAEELAGKADEANAALDKLEVAEARAKEFREAEKQADEDRHRRQQDERQQLAEVHRLWDQVRTPVERYREELERIDHLFHAGALGAGEDAERFAGLAGLKAREKYIGESGRDQGSHNVFASGGMVGSAAAYRLFYSTMAPKLTEGNDALAEARRQTAELGEIKTYMRQVANKQGDALDYADLEAG